MCDRPKPQAARMSASLAPLKYSTMPVLRRRNWLRRSSGRASVSTAGHRSGRTWPGHGHMTGPSVCTNASASGHAGSSWKSPTGKQEQLNQSLRYNFGCRETLPVTHLDPGLPGGTSAADKLRLLLCERKTAASTICCLIAGRPGQPRVGQGRLMGDRCRPAFRPSAGLRARAFAGPARRPVCR